MAPKRKLIEVAVPLEAINAQSAREKSIRHGHPSTRHVWWARRPLATVRAPLSAPTGWVAFGLAALNQPNAPIVTVANSSQVQP